MILTGTASGHNDLLDQLRDFLVNDVGWTEMDYSGVVSPGNDLEQVELHLRAPGASAGNEYFLNILTEGNVVSGAYGWRMRASQAYDPSVSDQAQEGSSPMVYFNLWQNTIPFWFYASGRRVIVVAKCNVSYVSMYAGLFLPFALPTEYTRPFFIAGNGFDLRAHDASRSSNSFIANPGDRCAYYLNFPANAWNNVKNTEDTAEGFTVGNNSPATIWPHRAMTGSDTASGRQDWNYNGMLFLRPNANGEQPAFLCHLISQAENRMVGTLDGVYSIGGFGRTSEQEVTLAGSPFRVFQNIFRTTPRDFMAIEEV